MDSSLGGGCVRRNISVTRRHFVRAPSNGVVSSDGGARGAGTSFPRKRIYRGACGSACSNSFFRPSASIRLSRGSLERKLCGRRRDGRSLPVRARKFRLAEGGRRRPGRKFLRRPQSLETELVPGWTRYLDQFFRASLKTADGFPVAVFQDRDRKPWRHCE